MKKTTLLAHLAVLLANLIYGINYSVAKGVMPDYVGPLGFIVVRVAGALVLFWILDAFLPKEKIQSKDYIRFGIAAVFGVATNQMLFFLGLNLTSPINASIIMTLNPILVLLAASVALRETISRQKIVGVALGIIGATTLIVTQSNVEQLSSNPLGDLLILLNATSYAIYLVMVKPLMRKYAPTTVIKWVFFFGFFFVIPFGHEEYSAINWSTMPPEIALSVLFVVIGTTFGAYLLNIYALNNLSPSTVSAYIYLQPFFAALIAVLFLGGTISSMKIIAAVLIFSGVFLVSTKYQLIKKRKPQ